MKSSSHFYNDVHVINIVNHMFLSLFLRHKLSLSFIWKMLKTTSCLVMRFPNDSNSMAHKHLFIVVSSGQWFLFFSFISHKAMNKLHCIKPVNETMMMTWGTVYARFTVPYHPDISYSTIILHKHVSISSISASVCAWGHMCCCCFIPFLCFSLSSHRAHLGQLLAALHVPIMTLITPLVNGALRNTAEWG